jgi:hypothetical protein
MGCDVRNINASNLTVTGAVVTNQEVRKKFIHDRLIGRHVLVGVLGTFDPKKEAYDGIYVPLPEYGIYLMYDYPDDTPEAGRIPGEERTGTS